MPFLIPIIGEEWTKIVEWGMLILAPILGVIFAFKVHDFFGGKVEDPLNKKIDQTFKDQNSWSNIASKEMSMWLKFVLSMFVVAFISPVIISFAMTYIASDYPMSMDQRIVFVIANMKSIYVPMWEFAKDIVKLFLYIISEVIR